MREIAFIPVTTDRPYERKSPGKLLAGLTGVLVLAFAFQLATRAVYSHLHVLPDGSLVSHAHPYDKSGERDASDRHRHSVSFLLVIETLETGFVLGLLVPLFTPPHRGWFRIPASCDALPGNSPSFLPGRSPPGAF
ncbi:MAG: hypothetical protein R2751_14720 [Bacteroidales bacterium]